MADGRIDKGQEFFLSVGNIIHDFIANIDYLEHLEDCVSLALNLLLDLDVPLGGLTHHNEHFLVQLRHLHVEDLGQRVADLVDFRAALHKAVV